MRFNPIQFLVQGYRWANMPWNSVYNRSNRFLMSLFGRDHQMLLTMANKAINPEVEAMQSRVWHFRSDRFVPQIQT